MKLKDANNARMPRGAASDSAAAAYAALYARFRSPPQEYGPSPFWWWTGEPLKRKRLGWQLDQLRSKGVYQVIVSYNHLADGTVEAGDPPVFSEEWWKLFRWTVAECKKRGMYLGIQDYCIINPMLAQIARDTPDMQCGQLCRIRHVVSPGERVELRPPTGGRALAAFASSAGRGRGRTIGDILDITGCIRNGRLEWNGNGRRCAIELAYVQPCVENSFDPMHPQAGAKVIERMYQPFEDRCPGELGKTIRLFFQDELDFGSRMPLWSVHLQEEFSLRKGYDLRPLLPALWSDIGPKSVKVRLDYSDVVTSLLEERYFIPIFQWHEQRGILLANDNLGRGGIEEGRRHYADPFRTMRWYGAPGTDDPNLGGPRAFKGLKVNSSISHLYARPRVWNECFHSSGWGASPAQVIAALNQDFIYGANVVNLHGLYYSTRGSWWEWAAPDFHFRQPYWQHSGALNTWITRMCAMLSAGVHVCDVAILYPIAALDGRLNSRQPTTALDAGSYSELQRGDLADDLDPAEAVAFGLGKYLVDRGIDFDFIDDQSLAGAGTQSGELIAGGERYRVLILPVMSSIRFASLVKAGEFFENGGIVIAVGCVPQASDRDGAGDPELDRLVNGIFGNGGVGEESAHKSGDSRGISARMPADFRAIAEVIKSTIVRDFIPLGASFQAVHRRIDHQDIYLVYNPGPAAAEADVFFRTAGRPRVWNAFNGSTADVRVDRVADDGAWLKISLDAGESRLIVFSGAGNGAKQPVTRETACTEAHRFAEAWEFTALPTMDNRFGDFRLADGAAAPEMIGVEARQFRYAEERTPACPWHRADFNDDAWPMVTCSYGPRLWRLGPLPPNSDLGDLERTILEIDTLSADRAVVFDGHSYFWKPYSFSLRWGVEKDPFLCSWASGPHGLKGEVPDDFIDLNCGIPGAVWYLATTVQVKRAGSAEFQMGSRSPYAAWVNGLRVLDQPDACPPGIHAVWNLPHYKAHPRRTVVALLRGDNRLTFRFAQSPGQRMRAYFAINPPASRPALALRWFHRPNQIRLNYRPEETAPVGWYRFIAPPGAAELRLSVRGSLRVWVNGREQTVRTMGNRLAEGGRVTDYRVSLLRPEREATAAALRIELPPGSFAGDGIPEPVQIRCVKGTAPLGDWSRLGLSSFSGLGRYVQRFEIAPHTQRQDWVLDLGAVAGSADVRVNGQDAGTLLCAPWRLHIGHLVKAGENELEITVANTLANHYSAGIPTPYVYDGQTVSGLLGPVKLLAATVTKVRKFSVLASRNGDS